MNLSWSQDNPFGVPILRRSGDFSNSDLFDANFPDAKPWYTPNHTGQSIGDDNAQWEGVGTGWYYSVLGGGYNKRQDFLKPKVDGNRQPVSFDNTSQPQLRGDFAVPTLFNGNFDAITSQDVDQPIPGWSLHGGDDSANVLQSHLEFGVAGNQSYALKLDNQLNSITHNQFVVPDWGALRLDAYVPIPAPLDNMDDYIQVDLQTDTQTYTLRSQQIDPLSIIPGDQINPDLPVVDLREVNPGAFSDSEVGNAVPPQFIESQVNRVGFGSQGFETFQVDLPDEVRGKTATLKISLHGQTSVYIDNVFFKSKNLAFGNPTLNGQQALRDEGVSQPNNYLIEKPQFAASYNESLKTPNWVSYQLNKSWIDGPDGSISRKEVGDPFVADLSLPSPPLTRVPNVNFDVFQRGHMTRAEDRSRLVESYYPDPTTGEHYKIYKDYKLTYLMSNIVPQNIVTTGVDPWGGLETFLSGTLVEQKGKELYIIAGRDGERKTFSSSVGDISAPSHVWKVVLVLDPGQSIADINKDTIAFAVDIPNYSQGEIIRGIPGAPATPLSKDWKKYVVSIKDLQGVTGYNFFPDIPNDIQEVIENNTDISKLFNSPSASLNADPELESDSVVQKLEAGTFINTSIGQPQIPDKGMVNSQNRLSVSSSLQTSINQSTVLQIGVEQVGISQSSFGQVSPFQTSFAQVNITPITSTQISTTQISPTEVDFNQKTFDQTSSEQVSFTKISSLNTNSCKINTSQINSSQVNIINHSYCSSSTIKLNSSKISFPSSVTSQNFFNSNTFPLHTLTPESIITINNTAQALWNTGLAPTTPFDINLQLTSSLSKGQLAEAIVTKYDAQGRPIGGTIEVDPTANGLGWFIDPTITDPTEFSQTLSSTASRATTNSDAYGHYDLLTALLHEMAHLAGFISGYSGFDRHVKTISGSQLFVGDNFTAPLTNDGSHLDPKTYAYDLLNPTLTPGLRELPSQIDVEILKEVRSADNVGENTSTQAALDSAPLTDILNGKFDISDPTDPNYGWTTRGAATILNKEAVLTEDSPLNSEFKQTFTAPQGAKYLEFTLKDTTLGDDSADSPGDAIEVALLDANEKTSLVDTAVGLTRTDALLNIQHDGHMYYGSNLIVPKTTTPQKSMTFKVDLSGIQAGTTATLYFDLLGFGNRDALVTIDNVQLLNNDPVPPVANNDTASTDAGKQVTINVQANDTSNQTIDPTSIALATNPTQGTIVINKNGTLAYTPNKNFVGTDTFTYTVANNDGTISDPANVTVTVNDVAPTITDLPVPKKVYELDPTTFTATATTTGDNHLTYIWDFGDGTDFVQGNTVQHTFTSSGEYQTTLTVIDAMGLKDTKTATVYVGSTAPTQGDDPTLPPGFGDVAPQITDLPVPKKVYQLDPTNFSANATSPLGEPLTYTWNFGDGTDAVVGQSVTHTWASSGQYDATLTVTDDFGFSDTKTVTVYVGSTAPTENDDDSLPDWNGDLNDIFSQIGNMS